MVVLPSNVIKQARCAGTLKWVIQFRLWPRFCRGGCTIVLFKVVGSARFTHVMGIMAASIAQNQTHGQVNWASSERVEKNVWKSFRWHTSVRFNKHDYDAMVGRPNWVVDLIVSPGNVIEEAECAGNVAMGDSIGPWPCFFSCGASFFLLKIVVGQVSIMS